MIYTETTRKAMDTIRKAFTGYIQNQNYFDIVFSEKIGYVWLIIDPPGAAGAEQLDTPEAMLDNLFDDIINDVVAPRETTSLTESHILTESEEAECRRRIAAILHTIEDGADEYLDYMDRYLKDYQERYHGNDE